MDTRTSGAREERIRGRAYAIWQKAGEPIGQDKAHWAKACEEIDEEDGQTEVHSEPIASSALPTAEEFASPAEEKPIAPAQIPVSGSARADQGSRGRRKGIADNGQLGAGA